MTRIIVERNFDSPVTDAALKSVMDRMGPCLEIYKVKWVRSHLATDRKRMMCEYDAADAESVRTVQREAKASFDRVWAAEVLGAS